MMLKSSVSAVPMPLLALKVPVKVPAAVGVPEITPVLLSVRPEGSAPAVTLKLGAGEPDAVQAKL